MNNEELNTALYKKMFAEQEEFKAWLVQKSKEDILDHAYEYNAREDILLSVENNSLSSQQAEALLESNSPLSDIYMLFDKRESSRMEEIWDCVESRANDVINRQKELCICPLYTKNINYALEHQETAAFRASADANHACVMCFERTVNMHYDGCSLDVKAMLDEVCGKFGKERVQLLLASTVMSMNDDGRVSDSNKAWAQTIPGAEMGRDIESVSSNVHPGLVNMVVSKARKEYFQEKNHANEKVSVRELLKQPVAQHKANKPPRKNNCQER